MLWISKWKWLIASIGAVILLLVGAAAITPSMIHPPYDHEPRPEVTQTSKPTPKPSVKAKKPKPSASAKPSRPTASPVRPSPGLKDVEAEVVPDLYPQARTAAPAPLKEPLPQPLPQRPPIVPQPIPAVPEVTTPIPNITVPDPIVKLPDIPLPVPPKEPSWITNSTDTLLSPTLPKVPNILNGSSGLTVKPKVTIESGSLTSSTKCDVSLEAHAIPLPSATSLTKCS